MWESVRMLFVGYLGDGLLWCLVLMALLYLFFVEKDKVNRILFIYVPIILLLLFFNPLFMEVLYGFIGEQIYYRILWLIPAGVVIAASIVKIYNVLNGKKQICFLVVSFAILALTGKCIYMNGQYSVADNLYHVPEEVVAICDGVEIEGREVMVAFPTELMQYVRQYTPYVCMPYGREVLVPKWKSFSELHDAMSEEELDVELVNRLATADGCHYIVLALEHKRDADFADYNYEQVMIVGKYEVLRNHNISLEL